MTTSISISGSTGLGEFGVVPQLQMLLFPNALCCSLYEHNCICAVTKIFTKFLPANIFCELLRVTRKCSCTSAGNAQEQLHFRDDQQRAFGISNIPNGLPCISPLHGGSNLLVRLYLYSKLEGMSCPSFSPQNNNYFGTFSFFLSFFFFVSYCSFHIEEHI